MHNKDSNTSNVLEFIFLSTLMCWSDELIWPYGNSEQVKVKHVYHFLQENKSAQNMLATTSSNQGNSELLKRANSTKNQDVYVEECGQCVNALAA